jgi:hypothetical protein
MMSPGDHPLQPPGFIGEMMLGGAGMGGQALAGRAAAKLPALMQMLKETMMTSKPRAPSRPRVLTPGAPPDIADLPPLPPPGRALTEAELAAEQAARDAAFDALGRTAPQTPAAMGRRQIVPDDLPPLAPSPAMQRLRKR